MGERNAKLNIGEESQDYAILSGSVGPDVLDIRKPYANTGMFTFDPGFTSTASCDSGLTYIAGDQGVLLHRGYSHEPLAEGRSSLAVSYMLIPGGLPPNDHLNAKID